VALVGRLEDLPLTELFHLLSLFQKCGKLSLNVDGRTGVFLFKKGKLVHATTGEAREPLGDILVDKGLISNETLKKALATQHSESYKRRFGQILIGMGAIEPEVLDGLIGDQMKEIVETFVHCDRGYFNFKPNDDEAADTTDFELAAGMNSDKFILDILTKIDEGDTPSLIADDAISEAPLVAREAEIAREFRNKSLPDILDFMVDTSGYDTVVDKETETAVMTSSINELRSMMVEIQLRSPSFSGGITLMILRFASSIVNRGVLCSVTAKGISGIGQFGIEHQEGISPDRIVLDMLIPCHEPSVFFEVIENMHTYRGPLKPCKWNEYLTSRLGGNTPSEVVAIPIIIDGMIEAIFYGDNLPDNDALCSIQNLEILLIEAGLAAERSRLKDKVQELRDQLRSKTNIDTHPRFRRVSG
jgi:hypothetical protein